MKSIVSEALGLKTNPVAMIFSDEKPESAMSFKEGKWGCVMWLFANAVKGGVSVVDEKTFGCLGGGTGLGFGNRYNEWPGGIECFFHFLSSGNESWEKGRAVAEKIKGFMREDAYESFMKGERYIESPDLVKKFVDNLPMTDPPAKYLIMKPLKDVDESKETPSTVVFTVNPDQLSALVVLANFSRESNENVTIPFVAGCQAIGIVPLKEAKAAKPRAVIGMTDISARLNVRKQLGADSMTFAVPFAMFKEMENNVEKSFLRMDTWKELSASP